MPRRGRRGEQGGTANLVVVEVAIGAAIIVVVAIAKEGEDTNAVKMVDLFAVERHAKMFNSYYYMYVC